MERQVAVLLLLAALCAGVSVQLNCTDPVHEDMYMNCSCMNISGIGQCDLNTGQCECDLLNETCFSLSTENNCCELDLCYEYNTRTGQCRPLFRSRTTAILLSVFLINFGAANFYIERYDLAIPQIILGLLLLFFQFGSCAVAATRDDSISVPCIVCCSINSFISLLFLAWWIADLIILATNQRLDGNNCELM